MQNGTAVFVARLVIGLAQGLALYFLYEAFETRSLIAANGLIFAPLTIVALFIPLLIMQALGNMRRTAGLVWIAAATAVIAGFAAYDVWHGWPTEWSYSHGSGKDLPRILPSFGTFFFSAVFLFIGQALVAAGDSDRKIIAAYATDFDVAWKQGLQLALAALFTGAFWLLLWLGAALFKLIDLDFLQELIKERFFYIPATALCVAAALHITDVRASLIEGARSLVLALLSWLLLLIVVLAGGFLISLIGTGLAPLWKTRMAASLLLTAAAAIIILINAAYQDGAEERRPVKTLRIAGTAGSLLLLPIVALAAYATYLRIAQYGWTADRISATACVVVAAAYAIGYAIAALKQGTWLRFIERWNFVTSLLVLAVIAALFSPLVDPMRIGVASQVARLESGKVPPEKFDYWYLRHDGGRFGKEALEKLASSREVTTASRAKESLKETAIALPSPTLAFRDRAKSFVIVPAGATLPESLLAMDWDHNAGINPCLTGDMLAGWRCTAIIKSQNGQSEIVLVSGDDTPGHFKQIAILRNIGGQWVSIGKFEGQFCGVAYSDLLAGRFDTVPPVQHDLMIAGRRIGIEPPPAQACQ